MIQNRNFENSNQRARIRNSLARGPAQLIEAGGRHLDLNGTYVSGSQPFFSGDSRRARTFNESITRPQKCETTFFWHETKSSDPLKVENSPEQTTHTLLILISPGHIPIL